MLSLSLLLSGMMLSVAPDTLVAANVLAERGISVNRTDTLLIDEAGQNISSLLLSRPEAVVSDYGGFAGLKSVNLRGLGSAHTSIMVDGIKISAPQSGQNDLGLLELSNYEAMVLDYAQNSVNFVSARPEFNDRSVAGKFSMGMASFGTWLPSGRFDVKLNENLSIRTSISSIISQGDYPIEGGVRTNNDIKSIRGGVDLFGQNKGGEWMTKLYINDSDRGTPGSLSWPSEDRQKDRNYFLQGYLKQIVSPLYSFNLSAKASYDALEYISSWGNSFYKQTGLQLNSFNYFKLSNSIDLSATAQLLWDGLESDGYSAARTDLILGFGASLKLSRFSAKLSLEHQTILDKGQSAHNVFSPALDIRYRISQGLSVFGFARRAFRAPTFNELYYPGYGNPALLPEDAFLSDLGIEYTKAIDETMSLKLKLDGYYNQLKDKITSAPSPDDPNIWLPYNISEIKSKGFDAQMGFIYGHKAWKASFDARYNYNDACNMPYAAKHNLAVLADISYDRWCINAVWNLRDGRKDSYGDMPSYNTLDMSFSKTLCFTNKSEVSLRLSCRNLADFRYELVSDYPMMGRNFLAGLEFKF